MLCVSFDANEASGGSFERRFSASGREKGRDTPRTRLGVTSGADAGARSMHRLRTAEKLGIPRRPATGERAVQFAGQRDEGKLDASRKLQIAEPEALQQHEDDEQREREIDDCRRIMLVAMIQAPMRAERVEAIVLDVPPPMAGAPQPRVESCRGESVVAQYQDLVSSISCHCRAMRWRRCVVSTACSTRSGSLTPSQDVKPSTSQNCTRQLPSVHSPGSCWRNRP